MSETSHSDSALAGTWKLLALQFEFADGGERQDLFGPSPLGRLIVTRAGDFMTVITSAERGSLSQSAELFETMMAYAGKFRVEGDKLLISCDLSWQPSWVGTEQVRFFELDGPALVLRTPKRTHRRYPNNPGYGVIHWRREC